MTGVRPAFGQPAIDEDFEVTVTRYGATATLMVTVDLTPEAPTIDITNAPATLRRNMSVMLNATVMPDIAPQEIIWSSGNPAAATVNAAGVVTARVATGAVVITARTVCGQGATSVTIRLSA